ncbi:hypothetical protein PybrP1_006714 [[Pythium] brassicae (nom. inval.)]|nr:hypothetical protein PybrP1_006714 [[Pythium] brassicae (nom. inval.)]
MVNATPITIDAAGTQAPFNWPCIAAGANKNTTSQLGRSCFKEFGVPTALGDYVGSYFWLYKIPLTSLHPLFKSLPLTANCQLKLRLQMNQGQFTIKSTSSGQGYFLKESIMSSGSTCPLMVASSYTGGPLPERLGTGTELQVQVGDDNCFASSLEYDFSSFKDELCKLAAINGDLDNRLNCGLLNESQWSLANRVLIADVSRMTHKDVPASIVVSGINGSSQGINLLVLVVYERELELDVLTGEVTRAD